VCLTAVAAPWLSPHDPRRQVLELRLRPPAWSERGEWAHPLGTDHLGRDILSRLIYGARVSLVVGVTSVVIGGCLGVSVGVITGYYGGRLDAFMMRVVDVQLAFPFILLAI
jgi:peptide/nickel transport system permease protein